MNPKHPIYIVSKGRWESRLTAKSLDEMKVPYFMVIEDQEYDNYAEVIDKEKLLILPKKYLEEYDTFDDLGFQKSKGPGAARNFAWEHSITLGAAYHWVMDDNISGFCRLNHNQQYLVKTGGMFRAAEDFVERYKNVAQAGLEYRFFSGGKRRYKPPFRLNTRIYSCILNKNDVPYRWRGRYNEDTDLSLRMLKDGWATILFHCFTQNKAATQTVKGGNQTDFYAKEGTLPKSEMLVKMHPDVSKLVERWGRWHHEVDYLPFKNIPLIKKDGLVIPNQVNEYGMRLVNES
jgi:hypothetical protein